MSLVLQTQYGAIVVAKLLQKLVSRNLFNSNYQRNAASGAIEIPTTPEDSLGDYNKGSITSNSISYDANAWIHCSIDNDKFLSKYLDGYNVASLPYNVLTDNLERLGYALAKAMDTNAITTLVRGIQGLGKDGNAYGATDPRYNKTGTIKTVAADGDIYDTLVELSGAMTDKGVSEDGRWLVVNGTGYAKIMASNKAIRQGDLSQEKVDGGVVAQIAGFDVYVTGQLTGNDASSHKIYAIAGHPDFCTRVESFAVEPSVIDANGSGIAVGGVFVQGRYVYTHEVCNPEAFGMITAAS